MHPTRVSCIPFIMQGMYFFAQHQKCYQAISESPTRVGCLNDGGPEADEIVDWYGGNARSSQDPAGRGKRLGSYHTKPHEMESWGVSGWKPSSGQACDGEPLWLNTARRDSLKERPVVISDLVDTASLWRTPLGLVPGTGNTPTTELPGHSTEYRNWKFQRWKRQGCRVKTPKSQSEWRCCWASVWQTLTLSTYRIGAGPRNPNSSLQGLYQACPLIGLFGWWGFYFKLYTDPLDHSPDDHQYEEPKAVPVEKSVPQPSVRDLLQQAVDESELLVSEGTAQEVPATDMLLAEQNSVIQYRKPQPYFTTARVTKKYSSIHVYMWDNEQWSNPAPY